MSFVYFRRTGRLSAVLLTLSLHGALLALLIYSFRNLTPAQNPARETLLRLPRLIEPKPAPRTIDARGNPIMISGNNGNRVREAPISRGRIYAYVMPD